MRAAMPTMGGSPASFKLAGGGKRKPRETGILFSVLAAFIVLTFLFALYSFSHRHHPTVRLEDYSKFATGMYAASRNQDPSSVWPRLVNSEQMS